MILPDFIKPNLKLVNLIINLNTKLEMAKTNLKKKIVDCVEHIDDEKILEAVYTLLNGQVANNDYELSAEDIKIIDARRKAVLKGEEKTYTVAQVKKKLL